MKFRFFEDLFTIRITHDFYQNQLSDDFTLVPTSECQKELKRHGLLFKTTTNGARVITEKVGDKNASTANKKVLRPISGKVKFTFLLVLKNPHFANFTDLGTWNTDFMGRKVYYLTNINQVSGVIDDGIDAQSRLSLSRDVVISHQDGAYLLPPLFTIPISEAEPFDSLKVWKTLPGTGRVEVTPELEPDTFGINTGAVQLDFRDLPSGKYLLELSDTSTGPSPVFQETYVNAKLLNQPVFGIVEIYKDQTIDYDQPVTYYLQFKNKLMKWKYFVVNSSKEEEILETGGTVNLNIQAPSVGTPSINPVYLPVLSDVDFDYVDSPDPKDQVIIDSFLPNSCFLFKASKKIPFFERPLPGIKLVRTDEDPPTGVDSGDEDEKVLLNNLPNFSPRSITPENIFINI